MIMLKQDMIFETAPDNFKLAFEVTSLFLEWDGKFLLLQRAMHKPQGGTWGVPAGKVEPGEQPDEALLRELREESGIHLTSGDLVYLETLYVRYPDYDFVYYMYRATLDVEPIVQIDPSSHTQGKWFTPQEALAMGDQLIGGLDICIERAYGVTR